MHYIIISMRCVRTCEIPEKHYENVSKEGPLSIGLMM